MKFIQLPSTRNNNLFYLNIQNIEEMEVEWKSTKTRTKQTTYTEVDTIQKYTALYYAAYLRLMLNSERKKIAEAEPRRQTIQ